MIWVFRNLCLNIFKWSWFSSYCVSVSSASAAPCDCITSLQSILTLSVCTSHTCCLIHKTECVRTLWLADCVLRNITRRSIIANGNLQCSLQWLHLTYTHMLAHTASSHTHLLLSHTLADMVGIDIVQGKCVRDSRQPSFAWCGYPCEKDSLTVCLLCLSTISQLCVSVPFCS